MPPREPRPRRRAPVGEALPPPPPSPPPSAAPGGLPEARGAWRFLALALAACAPAAGAALALLYWRSPDPRGRRFARWALALAALGLAFRALGQLGDASQDGGNLVEPW